MHAEESLAKVSVTLQHRRKSNHELCQIPHAVGDAQRSKIWAILYLEEVTKPSNIMSFSTPGGTQTEGSFTPSGAQNFFLQHAYPINSSRCLDFRSRYEILRKVLSVFYKLLASISQSYTCATQWLNK